MPKQLTPKQQYMIDQVTATMKIEDMEPSEDCIENLKKVAAGEKTIKQVIKELDMKYRR